ncbi:hypothetical protein HDC33_000194 [Sporosarcina sp. JAI121]|nr:hypothetical protein [Sporosarcina sp. JAI121]
MEITVPANLFMWNLCKIELIGILADAASTTNKTRLRWIGCL